MNSNNLDKRYVWHPYTQMKLWNNSDNITIQSGSSFSFVDSNERSYLDGISNMWCNVWGHDRTEIIDSMKNQLDTLPHSSLFGLVNEPSVKLAKRLITIAKGMSKVFYTDNGSTAIEAALKIAIQYWNNKGKTQKKEFISLKNGYHGDTIGCMSVGYVDGYFSPYRSLLLKTIKVDSPTIRHEKFRQHDIEQYVDKIENILKRKSAKISGMVMESGAQIAGGVYIYPNKFQKEISDLCKKYDVLLILDEIATGFGRLGNMIEYKAQRSEPDIVCFAKALTGGYFPLAVTLTTSKIFNEFLGDYWDKRQLFHGHTFTGHPVGCTAALTNLALYEKVNLIGKIRINSLVLDRLLKRFAELEICYDIRNKGLLCGIELRKGNKPINIIDKVPIGQYIAGESLKKGVYLRTLGNLITIIPPLAIGKEDLTKIVDTEYQIVEKIQKKIR
ncbi:MAG TPA: adenosylmethionine--8-amino-7-oxononanoate transaminase [Nitrososphaeraceae archaeon]|nr:adenosylmethionine--8-amino-7-oxononanoate transaminase [Nitrososphaeraceae archaeon]